MLWDLFCRVVDNHGDLGVCWRLAADLAARGEGLRLWVDDASALAWMAPQGASGVETRRWDDALRDDALPGDIVIEAFGCNPPAAFVARMAARTTPPVWINLEYLSAETYVERSHRLASPQSAGAGAGLVKWFFYPGFTPRTGGLLREPGLFERRRRFDAHRWLAARGLPPREGERRVSLFCYENAALPECIELLARRPTLLLAAPGAPARQLRALLGDGLTRGALRAVELPYLTQPDYDHLLWSCDLNLVRGEDSFVRAQWAGAPFLWQIYPQSDGAHRAKLEAFLGTFLAGAHTSLATDLRRLFLAWNGLGGGMSWPDDAAWRRQAEDWCTCLAAQPDLCTQLLGFAREKR